MFDDLFEELRSATQTPHVRDDVLAEIYNRAWHLDLKRTEDQLDPYLTAYFEGRAGAPGRTSHGFPSVSFTQYGDEPLPNRVRPLFDDDSLDLYPFSVFAREFFYQPVWRDYSADFAGYDGGDPHMSSFVWEWLNITRLSQTTLGRRLRRIVLDYESLCDGRDGADDMYMPDDAYFEIMLRCRHLEHLSITCAKKLNGFDNDFFEEAGPRIQKLRTLRLIGCHFDLGHSDYAWNQALSSPAFDKIEEMAFSRRFVSEPALTSWAQGRGVRLQLV